jgi:quercetin dioxygenase-like cupin family protein
MKRINFLIGFTLLAGLMLGLLGSRMSGAQDKDNLKGGKIL